jgi:RNA polymerase sigma factor (sigma-70 family)
MERQRSYLLPISLEEMNEYERQAMMIGTDMDLQERVAQREEIRQILAQLNPDQRCVIALRYGADLTEYDIAQILGWSIGTVKSRLHRARSRCRKLLLGERK